MKKTIALGLLGLCVAFFVGCSQEKGNTAQTKASPVAKSEVTQSSKVAEKTSGQKVEWLDHASPLGDYAFKYPNGWVVNVMGKLYVGINSPENEKLRATTDKREYMDDIGISYYESGNNFAGYPTFMDWIKDSEKPNSYISNVNKINFAGYEGWEMIMGGDKTGYVIMIEHNGHLYQISFNNGKESKDKLTEVDKNIINSFRFIDPVPETKNK